MGETGSDFYFRKLLERWRRQELGPPLSREEKQALIEWGKTSSNLRVQLTHEIAQEDPKSSEPAA